MKQNRLVRRQHPLFSPAAIFSTLILLMLLGIGLWTTGGRAFTPGELSAVSVSGKMNGGFANHAKFSDDCAQCHDPYQGITAGRCQACHLEIREQREAGMGLHGRLAEADCALCHQEHRGADYDLFTTAFDQFTPEHHGLIFSLNGAHTDLECESCHENGRYLGTPAQCAACHAEPELHQDLFGVDCARCHTDDAWRPAQLMQHAFSLDHGDEGQILCGVCHPNVFTAVSCHECHQPGEMTSVHLEEGINPTELLDCTSCHPTGKEDEAAVIMEAH